MMDVEKIMNEVRSINSGREQVGDVNEWDDQLMLFASACLIESFGVMEEGAIITMSNVEEFGAKVGEFFAPPKFISDSPFHESLKWWWEGVKGLIQDGAAFDDKGKPNYGAVMSFWKDKVEAEYGFRPNRTKEASMGDQIDAKVKESASLMRKKQMGHEVDKDALRSAARMLKGRHKQHVARATKVDKPAVVESFVDTLGGLLGD